MASVAQPGNSFACLTQLSHNGSWIFNFGASDHISGNKNLFTTLHSPSVSSIITLANGTQIMIKGVGESKSLSSLPLVSILYALECPFNLISISKLSKHLNCRVIFDPHFVLVQDRNMKKMIGKGCESNRLYYLAYLLLLVPLLLPLQLIFSITAWVILVFLNFKRWFLVFQKCLPLSVNRVTLGNILVVLFLRN